MKRAAIRNLICITILVLFYPFSVTAQKANQAVLLAAGDENWDPGFSTSGIDGTVLTLTVNGTDLYAGGSFNTAGQTSVNNIARWDGSAWNTLGSGGTNGTDGLVFAMTASGSDIFVAGSFGSAGGTSVNNIAQWDGSTFSALETGITDGDVRALVVHNTDLYVGGVFATAGGQSVGNIARWDGAAWHTLGTGTDGPVFALAVLDGKIIAGGSFTTAGGQSVNNIASWDPDLSSWSNLDTGLNLDVNALSVVGADLYVGGTFTAAGGLSAKKIAKWDGSNWSALGLGMTGGDIYAMATMGTHLFVAGTFTTAGVTSAEKIAKWDGNDWANLGSGISGGLVFALAENAPDVFCGGSFTGAGGNPSNSIARWTENLSVPVELSTFHASLDQSNVMLLWTTVTETNNYGFEIERMNSQNPTWTRIGFVQGQGTTTQPHNYTFDDNVSALQTTGIKTLRYRLKQIDLDGTFAYPGEIEVALSDNLPAGFTLMQNYPNPFNPTTAIEFNLPENGLTKLTVYDLRGNAVRELINAQLSEGVHRIDFNAQSLSTGVYYYVLKSEQGYSLKRTMILLK